MKRIAVASAILLLATAGRAESVQRSAAGHDDAASAAVPAQNCRPDYDFKAMSLLARVEAENEEATVLQDIEMADLPGGPFRMGCSTGDPECDASEKPVHTVDVPAFRMGRHDVTVAQFSRFVKATGYKTDAERDAGNLTGCYVEYSPGRWGYRAGFSWRKPGFPQGGRDPAVCVSWHDAEAYVQWLSDATGKRFRLPSEAEWEYAARGGAATRYYWGRTASHEQANYGANQCCQGATSGRDRWRHTSPVGSFPPNGFGLFDMIGNVRQWTADCVSEDYTDASRSAAPRTDGDCELRVVRNGSWDDPPKRLRVSARDAVDAVDRLDTLGFRIVEDR